MRYPYGRRPSLITRAADWWDIRGSDLIRRPICWVRGHPPIRKMDLRDGALCRRCRKYLKDGQS